MENQIHRIGVLTSGGDAPGMNAAVRAVVRSASDCGIGCVGIRRGWNGLITSDFVPLDASSVSYIIDTGGTKIYTDGKGVTRFSPLAAWSHEHVLAYIHYHQLPLPPIYGWKNGYLCGTHPWPARQWTGGTENGWREVYDIDSSIVIEAAEKIESARAFLKGVRA